MEILDNNMVGYEDIKEAISVDLDKYLVSNQIAGDP